MFGLEVRVDGNGEFSIGSTGCVLSTPSGDHAGGGLQMELKAPRAIAVTEGLMGALLGIGEMDSPGGEGEGFVVPVHDRFRGPVMEKRIGGGCGDGGDREEADFGSGVGGDDGAEGLGEELGAQADGEDRNGGEKGVLEEAGLQVKEIKARIDRLGSSKND